MFAKHVASMSSCALCATKVHKIVGMAAPNATFFVWWAKYFECVWVVDVVRMALLIIYKVCVWLGVGWAIAYRTICREQWLRVSFWLL